VSELPKGWVETSIERITSDVSYGVTAKSDPNQGDLRMLRITDIQNNKVNWETVPFCHYDSRFEKAFLANDDIVVARTGATVGKSFLIENAIENSVYASYLIRLRVAEHVLPKYVAWFLHSPKYWQQIIEKQEGIGQPNVNGTKLKTLRLGLAPIAEQKRIVEKLDQVLAQVDTIKARLDCIPAILKRFRQSVLAAAVSGKLTEEWRNLKLLPPPRDIQVDTLIDTLDQGWSPKCINEEVIDGEWGVIKTSAVQSGFFVKKENKRLPKALQPRGNLGISRGDVLITRAVPRVRCGVTCLVENDYPNLMICDKVYRIRVNQKLVYSSFLNWCFNSQKYLKEIEKLKTGSSESGMNMTQKKLKGLV